VKVSVIIPCRNEIKHITACVEAIFANTLAQKNEVEVLVIDGMSDDGTVETIKSLIIQYPSLRLIENPQQVTPVAFNLGITHSIGNFVQIIGARQIISLDYLEKAVETIENNPAIWCVGGRVENIFENKESQIIANAMNTSFGVGGGNFRTVKESAFVDTAGTPMYPRFVFDKIGIFDEELVRNQDDEFNFRVLKAGGKIYLNADIVIQYFVRADYKKLYNQYLQYGYWKVYVNRKHKTVTTIRQLFPAGLISFLIMGALASFISPYLALVYSVVIFIYILLALAFAVKAMDNISQLFPIMKTFFILHLSYGWGYMKGLWDFVLLQKKPAKKLQNLTR
jgi:GT2 family glycosyltransferase